MKEKLHMKFRSTLRVLVWQKYIVGIRVFLKGCGVNMVHLDFIGMIKTYIDQIGHFFNTVFKGTHEKFGGIDNSKGLVLINNESILL